MDPMTSMYVASAAKDVGNNIIGALTKKADRKYAKKESELAYSRNMAHYQANNEYNSPKAQMGRYADAGLNPNLVYGNMANTPATASVQYQNQKSDRTLPGISSDPARMANVGIQQQGLDQQIYYQGKMLEQQVRMNDQILQNMEIKNTNMESNTEKNKIDIQGKLLTNMATSLGIKYNYGETIDGKKTKGIMDYQLDYKAGLNKKLGTEIGINLQKMSLNEKLIWWAKQRQKMMEDTGTNIDKDGTLERKLSKGWEGFWKLLLDERWQWNGKWINDKF